MAEKLRSFSPTEVVADEQRDTAANPGQGVLDFGEIDELEADGSHQGLGRRADKAPSDREHGKKTRQRTKDIINGRG